MEKLKQIDKTILIIVEELKNIREQLKKMSWRIDTLSELQRKQREARNKRGY